MPQPAPKSSTIVIGTNRRIMNLFERPCGLDHQLQCFRRISGGAALMSTASLVLNRVQGRGDFGLRDIAARPRSPPLWGR